MVLWRSAGDILRWWRGDVLGLTQQQAADRLNVQASALSHWERDARAISIDLAAADEALDGGHVLRDLLWAANTPRGLEPGHLWTQVFPGPSAPVWVWIRTPASKIFIQAEWGVARIDTVLEPGPNGAFITVGASVPDSPAVLYLSELGWADFGHGELPPDMPGAPVLSPVADFSASSADGRFMEFFRSHLQAQLADPSTPGPRLDEVVPGSIKRFIADRTRREPVKEPHKTWPVHARGIDAVERERFARLRQARGLSRTEMASRVAELTNTAVSRDTIRRFELHVGRPHDPMLPVALDHALGAGGRLATLEIRSGSGPASISLPPYWRGPIWLSFDGPDDEVVALLHRKNWRRLLPISGTTLVSVHWFEPDVPLRIDVDRRVGWRVGVGRRADAEPIDQNWEPASVDVAQEAASKTHEAIIAAAERHRRNDEH